MKKFLILLATALSVVAAQAGEMRCTGIEFAKGVNFEAGLGLPHRGAAGASGANMPYVFADINFGLKNGFIQTKKFGANGGIDLGAYWGICHYGDSWSGVLQNTIVIRPAFHYQFVKHLDTYAGFLGGVNIWGWTGDAEDAAQDAAEIAGERRNSIDNGDVRACVGMFYGGKWFFNQTIGVKLEFSHDWVDGNLPTIATGVSIQF